MTRSAPRRAGALALALALGACAPRPAAPPRLEPQSLATRYVRAEDARRTAARALEAEVRAWFAGPRLEGTPAVRGWLALAGPDAARLRVESLFGTAFDLGAHGDSVIAWVPSRRVGFALDARTDSLALPSPGPLALRVFGALWTPPASAWREAPVRDSLLVLAWAEDGDSVEVAVGASGLPRSARVSRDGAAVFVRYESYESAGGTAWPARLAFGDGAGEAEVRCVVGLVRVRASLAPERLTVRVPERATLLSAAEVSAWWRERE